MHYTVLGGLHEKKGKRGALIEMDGVALFARNIV